MKFFDEAKIEVVAGKLRVSRDPSGIWIHPSEFEDAL